MVLDLLPAPGSHFEMSSKNTFTVPSVILTTLLGERVQAWDAENRYCDVPTTLNNVIADLDAWLDLRPSMPMIEDPSCPGTTFNHRWDEDDYSNFQEQIAYYSDKVTSAYEEADKDKSLALWQEVFGPEFRRSAREAGGDLAKVSTRAVRRRDPGEEFIDEQPGLTLAGGYRLRIVQGREEGRLPARKPPSDALGRQGTDPSLQRC